MFALGEILGVLRLRTVFRSRETSCSAQDDRLGERKLFAGGGPAPHFLLASALRGRVARAHTAGPTLPHPHCHTYLQRYVPVLLWRVLIPLRLQHLQRLDQLLARLPGLDYCV